MMPIDIRPYRPSDAQALANLFFDAVRGTNPGYYTEEQVIAWLPAPPTPEALHCRIGDGRTVFVALSDAGDPIGFGDIEPDGHIDMLFCRSDQAGRGVGRALFEQIERAAHSAGIDRIFVEASEPAKRLFERRGFRTIARQDLVRGGVSIHNYRMEKDLFPALYLRD
jgi:putative acetyltransferase